MVQKIPVLYDIEIIEEKTDHSVVDESYFFISGLAFADTPTVIQTTRPRSRSGRMPLILSKSTAPNIPRLGAACTPLPGFRAHGCDGRFYYWGWERGFSCKAARESQLLPHPDGEALFTKKCASCHQPNNDMRAPDPNSLRQMTAASILAALQSGRMKWEAKFLSRAKNCNRRVPGCGKCFHCGGDDRESALGDLDPPPNPSRVGGLGSDPQNSRFQPALAAGMKRARSRI